MRTLLCLFLLCSLVLAQDVNSAGQGQSLADMARKLRKDHTQETRLTPEEEKKLLGSISELFTFASEDSGFAKRSVVKSRFVEEKEVETSTKERLSKKEYTQRFARSELTMKKFGLLPRDFSLREFMVKASGKQVAGYYDDETKVISLLNWVPFEKQAPVLAHELTHALQDQNFDLQNWLWEKNRGAQKAKVSANGNDDGMTARDAVVEGQAMVVYIDYLLAGVGRNLQNTPGLVYQMEDPAVKASPDTELLHDAPMILREAGTFPYKSGLIFEVELLQAGRKEMAFAGAFARPPHNTHEVLQPRAYIEREKLPPLTMPDMQQAVKEKYEVFDTGSIGELDVRAILEQSGNRKIADSLASNWQGGRYIAFRKLSGAAEPSTTADLALFYVSRWKTPESAAHFAKLYAGALQGRYVQALAQPAPECTGNRCPVFSSFDLTEEGPTHVEQWADNTVIVCESFDEDTANQLRSAWLEKSSSTQADNFNQDELGLRLRQMPGFAAFQHQIGEEILRQVVSAVH
jgi:hypothetical protein